MRRETSYFFGFSGILVACLIVGGCADLAATDQAEAPATPPDKKKLAELVTSAFAQAKLSGKPEVSQLRGATHGPGQWMFCLKSTSPDQKQRYAVYLRDNTIAEIRAGVFIDGCIKDSYGPLPK